MLVTKFSFKLMFVLSNYQTCTFPLKQNIKTPQTSFDYFDVHNQKLGSMMGVTYSSQNIDALFPYSLKDARCSELFLLNNTALKV